MKPCLRRGGVAAGCALAAWIWLAAGAAAQLPTPVLKAIFPLGARAGATVELKLSAGDHLPTVDRLWFAHPGITAVAKTRPSLLGGDQTEAVPGEFIVTVADDVPAGLYDVWAVGRLGVSNPRTFAVGGDNEVVHAANIQTPAAAMPIDIDSVVNGVAAAAQAQWFRVSVPAGKPLVIRAEAEELDSRMRPVVVLYDAQGRELSQARAVPGRGPVLNVPASEPAEYLIQVHDQIYVGGAEFGYRLTVSSAPHVELVFPPVVDRTKPHRHVVYGYNLPGDPAPASSPPGSGSLRQLTIGELTVPETAPAGGPRLYRTSEQALTEGLVWHWHGSHGASNPTMLALAEAPLAVEQEPNNSLDEAVRLEPPFEFVGQFDPRDDVDVVTFTAAAGQPLWIEIIGQRLAGGANPRGLLQRVETDANGQTKLVDVHEFLETPTNLGGLAFNTAHQDGAYLLSPSGAATYAVTLRDVHGQLRGDPRHVYRLIVRPATADFRLVAFPKFVTADDRQAPEPRGLLLGRGDRLPVEVLVERLGGFRGEVRLRVEGLPKGVTCGESVVGPATSSTTLVLAADDTIEDFVGPLVIVGEADGSLQRVARWGTVANSAGAGMPAWSRAAQQFVLATAADKTAPCRVEFGTSDSGVTMARGGQLKVPVRVVRSDTSQDVALVALGLPGDFKAAPLTIAAKSNEGTLTIDIPAKAALGRYSVCLRGATKIDYEHDPVGARLAAEYHDALKQRSEQLVAEKADADADAEHVKTLDQQINRIADALKGAEKQAADAAAAAKSKSTPVVLYSASLLVEVVASPVRLEVALTDTPARPGDEFTLPIVAHRLYDYAETVELELIVPKELAGIGPAKLSLAADATKADWLVKIPQSAPAGTWDVSIVGRLKFNNQPLEWTTPLRLTIAGS